MNDVKYWNLSFALPGSWLGLRNMTYRFRGISRFEKKITVSKHFFFKDRKSPLTYTIISADLCSGLAQPALQSFSKMSFVWKYYKVCKQPLIEARDAEEEKNIVACRAWFKMQEILEENPKFRIFGLYLREELIVFRKV